jgi:hypothetical protein
MEKETRIKAIKSAKRASPKMNASSNLQVNQNVLDFEISTLLIKSDTLLQQPKKPSPHQKNISSDSILQNLIKFDWGSDNDTFPLETSQQSILHISQQSKTPEMIKESVNQVHSTIKCIEDESDAAFLIYSPSPPRASSSTFQLLNTHSQLPITNASPPEKFKKKPSKPLKEHKRGVVDIEPRTPEKVQKKVRSESRKNTSCSKQPELAGMPDFKSRSTQELEVCIALINFIKSFNFWYTIETG